MDTKTWIISILCICALNSCGNNRCTNTDDAQDQKLDIVLLNRRDTLHVGDTLLFKSHVPLLPYSYHDVTWDERVMFIYKFNGGRLFEASTSLDSLFSFLTDDLPYNYANAQLNDRYYSKDAGPDEYFSFGLVTQDTGNFWITLNFHGSATFIDQTVPDYKGKCERNLRFNFNFTNLYNQPLHETLLPTVPYRSYLCVANTCDTLVNMYAFRVEP